MTGMRTLVILVILERYLVLGCFLWQRQRVGGWHELRRRPDDDDRQPDPGRGGDPLRLGEREVGRLRAHGDVLRRQPADERSGQGLLHLGAPHPRLALRHPHRGRPRGLCQRRQDGSLQRAHAIGLRRVQHLSWCVARPAEGAGRASIIVPLRRASALPPSRHAVAYPCSVFACAQAACCARGPLPGVRAALTRIRPICTSAIRSVLWLLQLRPSPRWHRAAHAARCPLRSGRRSRRRASARSERRGVLRHLAQNVFGGSGRSVHDQRSDGYM